MSAVSNLSFSVYPVNVPLTLLQRTTLFAISEISKEHEEGLAGIESIYKFGIFIGRKEAINVVEELARSGWLLSHDYSFKLSPKAINWLKAEGVDCQLKGAGC